MIIAIDGPAATGKSTTAKAVASRLGFTYLDTGAMYRAVTFAVLDKNITISDKKEMVTFLKSLKINFISDGCTKNITLNNKDITNEIREPYVTAKVSEVSAIPSVRESMVSLQRKLAQGENCIVEGRDIGTVVFPNADLKFFMIADDKIRAERRRMDLLALGRIEELEDLETEIKIRDEKDSSRNLSPLKRAKESVLIDTSRLDFQEQVELIISKIKQKQKEKRIND